MTRGLIVALLLASAPVLSVPAQARGSAAAHAPHAAGAHAKAVGVPRDSHGKIARSESAKRAFLKAHPCPAGQKCVVDHIKPLACGGADTPANMQLQTVEAAKAKDRTELSGPGCPPRK